MIVRYTARVTLAGIFVVLALFSLSPASASSANISHSYNATDTIKNGSIVSLDPKRENYIILANTVNGAQLLGVAVASNDSLLAVDPATGKTQVATSGMATTLVSTLNGPIKVGDKVSVSPLNGVGMRSEPGSRVIGLAQSSFSEQSEQLVSESVKDKNGKSTNVKFGYVQVSVAIGADTGNGVSDAQLNSLQKIGKSITGRTLSTFRVAASAIVAIAAIISLITLIYASVYGSIISIGRNPLSKVSVFRAMRSVLAMAVFTVVVSSLTIVMLLR